MGKFAQRILAAIDLSTGSACQAFQYAVQWAESCQSSLDIVHVMGSLSGGDTGSEVANRYIAEKEKTARSTLEQVASQGRERIPSIHSYLLEGFPEKEITKFAVNSQSDLVITGTGGSRGMNRIMMGSVAERVVCLAPCPVLTVRSVGKEEGGAGSFLEKADGSFVPQHVLLPIDFTECSWQAFQYTMQVAKAFQCSVTLLHVVERRSYSIEIKPNHPTGNLPLQEQVELRLSEMAERFRNEGIAADYHVKDKSISDAIGECLADSGADLIIMGTHGYQGVKRLILGSVAATVLRQSSCPVLTVKYSKLAALHQ